jgi:hypothetical protein
MAQVVFGKTADDVKRAILVEDDGTVVTSGGGVGGSGATAEEIDDALRATALPVSAASLPLPSGAATAAVIGAVDETAAATNSASSGLNGLLRRLLGFFKLEDDAHVSADAGLPALVVRKDTLGTIAGTDGDYTLPQVDSSGRLRVVYDSGSGATNAKSGGWKSAITVTRPANTTAYDAGDVVGATAAAITFTTAGGSGLLGFLSGVSVLWESTALISGMANFRLHLYDVTPPSALADGAQWDLPSGDRTAYLGFVDLGTPVDVGSSLWQQVDKIEKLIKFAAASTTLYGYLVTEAAWTPTSAQVFRITTSVAPV